MFVAHVYNGNQKCFQIQATAVHCSGEQLTASLKRGGRKFRAWCSLGYLLPKITVVPLTDFGGDDGSNGISWSNFEIFINFFFKEIDSNC